jgi:hypothetical protein
MRYIRRGVVRAAILQSFAYRWALRDRMIKIRNPGDPGCNAGAAPAADVYAALLVATDRQ